MIHDILHLCDTHRKTGAMGKPQSLALRPTGTATEGCNWVPYHRTPRLQGSAGKKAATLHCQQSPTPHRHALAAFLQAVVTELIAGSAFVLLPEFRP